MSASVRARLKVRLVRCLVVAGVVAGAACKGDPLAGLEPGTGPTVSDADLKTLIQANPNWVYYKRSMTPITRSSVPHPEQQALVRFNPRAATQLDAAGKVKAVASFPDSSVIVKELSTNGVLGTYAVMMKLRNSASAGFGGWVWAEYERDGRARYSTAGRGAACSACHSPGIDYTRMNDSHP